MISSVDSVYRLGFERQTNMKSRRVDWTLWMLGVLCAVCIGTLVMYAVKARADVTIQITGSNSIAVTHNGDEVYNGFAIWQADFTTACHASPPDKQLQVGFSANGVRYSGWVNAGCDYGPGFDAVHLIAVDGTHWVESGEGYIAETTWDGMGDGTGSVWTITRAATFRHAGDFNRDARVDTQDVFDFLADWFSRPEASVGELYAFLADWAAGAG